MDYTIKQVKSMLNIDIENPKLLFKGEILMDDNTLNYYGIKDEYTLKIMDESPLNDPNMAIQSTIQCQSKITETTPMLAVSYTDIDDPLAKLLQKHNCYEDLYVVLKQYDIDIETLENDLKLEDVDEFAKEYGLSLKQKLKFKKLLRIISKEKEEMEKSYASQQNIYNNLNAAIEFGGIYKSMMAEQDLQEAIAKQRSLDDMKRQSAAEEYQAQKKGQDFLWRQNLKPDDKMVVVLVGDTGAGKTSLMRKYCNDEFDPNVTSSIGVDQMWNIQPLGDNTNMEINIWDTAGQERLQSIGRSYYRRADCMIICYDLSIENPFRNFEHWRTQIEEHGNDDVVVIMVGCKLDLAVDAELTQTNETLAMSILEQEEWKKFNPISCKCSSKTGHNVNGVFIACGELVLRIRGSVEEKKNVENVKRKSLQEELDDKKAITEI